MKISLKKYETRELVEELQNREGVDTMYVSPHKEYGIDVDTENGLGMGIRNTGPAVILTVID